MPPVSSEQQRDADTIILHRSSTGGGDPAFAASSSSATSASASASSSAASRGTGSKRQPYVNHACSECKKRKTRCCGSEPCTQCTENGILCAYTNEPRKRRTTASTSIRDTNAADADAELATWREMLSAQVNAIAIAVQTSQVAQASRLPPTPQSGVSALVGVEERLLQPFYPSREPAASYAQQPCWLAYCSNHAHCYLRELALWDAEIAHAGAQPLREATEQYFSLVYPHCPILDEAAFFADLTRYASGSHVHEVTLARIQFIVLCQLILANRSAVNDFCDNDDQVPGWSPFLRAHHLLDHIVRGGKADVTTIQCLVLKCNYLMHIERPDWAYDDTGTAVRLLYQLRLRDESNWTELSDAQVSSRRRLLYAVYSLDRIIAHHLDSPYRLHDPDISVNLPEVHAAEDGSYSPVPFLLAVVRWVRLVAKVEAAMFRPNAAPPNEEFRATTEARISVLSSEIPSYLQWSTVDFKAGRYMAYPHYILRQALTMHLRLNALRLLIHRRSASMPRRTPRAIQRCIDLGTSSINAMYEYHISPVRLSIERHSIVTYLPGALTVLTTVIRDCNGNDFDRGAAIRGFEQGVHLLNDIAPGFIPGRRLQTCISPAIEATKSRIEKIRMPSAHEVPRPGDNEMVEAPAPAPAPSNEVIFSFDCDEFLHMEGFKSFAPTPSDPFAGHQMQPSLSLFQTDGT